MQVHRWHQRGPSSIEAHKGFPACVSISSTALHDVGGASSEGEADFVAFFDQWKSGYHGQRKACNASDDAFVECATCTGGCRAAFACLNRDGLSREAYDACMRARGVR